MTDKEVMQLALDNLIDVRDEDGIDCVEAIIKLRAALAQPEPEPVAFMDCFGQVFNPDQNQCYIRWTMRDRLPMEKDEVLIPLYTTQLRSEWVGLTDEQIEQIVDYWNDPAMFIDAIEAKLKEKNGY